MPLLNIDYIFLLQYCKFILIRKVSHAGTICTEIIKLFYLVIFDFTKNVLFKQLPHEPAIKPQDDRRGEKEQ